MQMPQVRETIHDVVEFEPAAGRHVNQHGQLCDGRTFEVIFHEASASMARCRVCHRELSIENDELFDPYPPPASAPNEKIG
jgi:hypothetical protein